jgi:spermidine synthase
VKKWTTLEQTTTPDGSKLTLSEHDGEYVLRVNGRELMSNRRHASELRLGELAGLAKTKAPRILIGGLGLGYTLRGALATAPSDADIIVAELMPEIVAWNQNKAYPLAADALSDPRTSVVIGDVFDIINNSITANPFDAILLDADNGTTAMMTEGNSRLYDTSGLALVRAALNTHGLAVYWSATREPELERHLKKLGFGVTTEIVRAYGHGGPRHTLVIGRKLASLPRR